MKRESLKTSLPSPHFQSRSGLLNHTGGTYSHNGMMDYQRILFGKIHDSMEFQIWKVNFRTEACLRRAAPQITMHWVKEIEIAQSIVELMTLRSIVGRNDFPDYGLLDAMIASALGKLPNTQSHFRKRVSVEEHRAQKHNRSYEEDRLHTLSTSISVQPERMKRYKVYQTRSL